MLLFLLVLGFVVIRMAASKKLSPRVALPKLICFDLDGTIWYPDMYMLWGGGAPFTIVNAQKLLDNAGQEVKLLGISGKILQDINTQEEFKDTQVAWVSKTDEPSWADECLRKFETPSGIKLIDTAQHKHVCKGSKASHFRNLQRETGVSFDDMLFFDNESGNIQTVRSLGVISVYCPDGMTEEIWLEGLRRFEKSRNY
jgi:magnesium-dependent phosphatase 1